MSTPAPSSSDNCRDVGSVNANGATRLLSVVLPCFNEQEVLPLTHARFSAMAQKLAALGLDYELVFVNDGSRDRTPELLNELASRERHVRVVHLARNFGHQAAVSAGLSVARGDCVAVMDCDLQDPPEVLPDFLAKWRDGYQVVYAIRKKRKEWFGKRLAYWTFYRLLAAVSDLDIPLDSGDFCLMDRSAVSLLNSLPERQRFVRGLRTWIGLRQTGIEYERPARAAGQAQYTFSKLVKLAMDGLVSFSSVPLKMVTRLGLLSLFAACAIGLWVVGVTIYEWDKGIIGRTPRGWASLACIVLIMSAVQMISLGIIGEYLARIFLEVKGRPTFLIASVVEGTDIEPAGGPAGSRTQVEAPGEPASARSPITQAEAPGEPASAVAPLEPAGPPAVSAVRETTT